MHELIFFRPNIVEKHCEWTRINIDRVLHNFKPKIGDLKARINYDIHTLFHFKIRFQIPEENFEKCLIFWIRAALLPEPTEENI